MGQKGAPSREERKLHRAWQWFLLTLWHQNRQSKIQFGAIVFAIITKYSSSLCCRYTSKCLLLEFMGPALDIPMTQYAELPELLQASSSAIGGMIGLGRKFVESGIREMDSELLPELRNLIGENIIPRVLPSYSILLWFTMEVHFTVQNAFPLV